MQHTEEYRERLMECPPHNSEKFLAYLRENNEVVAENESWLLIKNCKYHTEQSGHYTAFLIPTTKYKRIHVGLILPHEWRSLFRLYMEHCYGWEIKIKKYSQQSIERFHVHFIQ